MRTPLQQQQPDYMFYPSQLDKFQGYLDCHERFESRFNIDENGNYKKSFEEIELAERQALIDSINRVPFTSVAADKGTAFNEIVDAFLNSKKPEKVQLFGSFKDDTIRATINENVFYFGYEFCLKAVEYFAGCLNQVYTEANIETKYGVVKLYGYVDEVKRDIVYDIKTTSRYEFGKYSKKWQRHLYPYALIESGYLEEVKAFEYTAYALKGGTPTAPKITGVQYPEYYAYDHKQSTEMLTKHCERFIEFIEQHRDLITDKKIFNDLQSQESA